MKTMHLAALAAAALIAATAAVPQVDAKAGAKEGKCVTAGGAADMVTQGLAEFMANAALNNSIKAHGWTAKGPVKMTCGTGVPVNCVAKQRACS